MRRHAAVFSLTLVLAACATRPPASPDPASRPSASADAPLSRIHRDLTELETVWHVRAGLNVAALSCRSRVGNGIISDYNGFLKSKRALLSLAYEAKADRYRAKGGNWQRELDTHMTKLYNHFAQTSGQAAFCGTAAAELRQAIAADPDAFRADAGNVLARLDRPFLARGSASPAIARAIPASAAGPAAAALPLAPGWGVQLGAFGSRKQAQAAWTNVAGRAPRLAAFRPHYEDAPGGKLVRLQVKGLNTQADAIELCAHAAAAGFDCMPVRVS